MRDEARLRIMAARIIAQGRWPYVSTLLFSLRPVEILDNSLSTLAVDAKWRMYYSPKFALEHPPEVLATGLLHEVMHCIMRHSERFNDLNQEDHFHPYWNYVGDTSINAILDEAKIPWGDFEPVRYSSLTKYSVLPTDIAEGAFFKMKTAIEESQKKSPKNLECGSSSGGTGRNYEVPEKSTEHPGVREDQQDVIRDRVAHDILQHKHEKRRGDIPGGLLRWAQSILEPKISWKTALAGSMRRSLSYVLGRRDFVYTYPSRRQSAMQTGNGFEIILPSMRKPKPPAIAVIIDTSGSVTQEGLAEVIGEVDAIAKLNGIASGLFIFPCDAQVGEIQRVKSRSALMELRLTGGGGTDLRPAFDAVEKMRPTPRILIVATDGFTPWPESKPKGVDSVIILLSDSESMNTCPSWAVVHERI